MQAATNPDNRTDVYSLHWGRPVIRTMRADHRSRRSLGGGSTLVIGSVSVDAGVAAGFDGGWIQGVVVGCAVPTAVAGLAAIHAVSNDRTWFE